MALRDKEMLQRDALAETYAELAIRLGLLALLVYWSLTLIRPFLSVIIWSIVLAVALYPIFERLSVTIGGRRRIAAAIVTVVSLLVVLGPATWLVLGVIDSGRLLLERAPTWTPPVPHPTESVRRWPFIGEQVFQFWELAATNLKVAVAKVAPHLKPLGTTMLRYAGDAGIGTLKFLGAVVLAGFLLAPGPILANALKSFVERVAPAHGEQFVNLAGSTIRKIAQGVVGIAAVQAFLGGVAFIVADAPAVSLLVTAVLILGILQIGPTPVFLPMIIWGWVTMDTAPALMFTIYLAGVGVLDNLLRPIIMRRGLTTPLPVMLIGLFGGMLSYGITGLFLGPIILAVIWELAAAWIYNQRRVEGQQQPS